MPNSASDKTSTEPAGSIPSHVPSHVFEAFFAAPNPGLTRTVVISNRGKGIKGYGFAFDGAPVPMQNGRGTFQALAGQTRLLEWVMKGDPNSSMTVTVFDGQKTQVAQRPTSSIPGSDTRSYDALQITG